MLTPMSWDQWGPLIGVVVGAILGGGAQMLNEALRDERQSKRERAAAAKVLVEAFYAAQRNYQLYQTWRKSNAASARERRDQAGLDTIAARSDFDTSRVHLLLLDDRDEVARATRGLRNLLGHPPRTDDDEAQKKQAHKLDELIRLMRE